MKESILKQFFGIHLLKMKANLHANEMDVLV